MPLPNKTGWVSIYLTLSPQQNTLLRVRTLQAGVLRGKKSRFQLFGDTVNTGKSKSRERFKVGGELRLLVSTATAGRFQPRRSDVRTIVGLRRATRDSLSRIDCKTADAVASDRLST